jgi:hypothetical protein
VRYGLKSQLNLKELKINMFVLIHIAIYVVLLKDSTFQEWDNGICDGIVVLFCIVLCICGNITRVLRIMPMLEFLAGDYLNKTWTTNIKPITQSFRIS